jgi:hypothetical protein
MIDENRERYKAHIVSAIESLTMEDMEWLNKQTDKELLSLICQMGAVPKRDFLITLLNTHSANVMIRLTRWIAILTWVLVAVGVTQAFDMAIRYWHH